MTDNAKTPPNAAQRGHGFLGSLKDALAAAGRDDAGNHGVAAAVQRVAEGKLPPAVPAVIGQATDVVKAAAAPDAAAGASDQAAQSATGLPSAADAAREVRGTVALRGSDRDRQLQHEAPPTTRVVRAARAPGSEEPPARTQLVRGRQKVQRNAFAQDPVVGWLVIVGGPGLGAFRPVFEGNNTIGRAKTQRIPLDFGDDAISSEEQAYIRYDSADRSYLFVPNLAKTNVVSVNDKRPTGAVELAHMDVITVGRTQLVFVPFCGRDFDWSELADTKD